MSPWNRIHQEVDAVASREDRAEGPARAALLTGVSLSAAFLILGLLAVLFHREARPNEPPSISEMLRGMAGFRGPALLYAGLLVLAFTPVLRVIVMMTVYGRRREWFMFAVSVIVLSLLTISLVLGTG